MSEKKKHWKNIKAYNTETNFLPGQLNPRPFRRPAHCQEEKKKCIDPGDSGQYLRVQQRNRTKNKAAAQESKSHQEPR